MMIFYEFINTNTLIESNLDHELSVIRCQLWVGDGELPNYISLMVQLLTWIFSAILFSVY